MDNQNQSYWFVLREEPNNVVFSGNNITIQNPQFPGVGETKYIVETEDRQFIQIAEQPVKIQTELVQTEVSIPQTSSHEDFWNKDKIKFLLNLTNCDRTGNLSKEKDIWIEIATVLNTTPEECAKKYRVLRNTYIRLTKKKRLGKVVKWVYYNICEEFFKTSPTFPPALFETWEEHKTHKLLSLYIDNLPRFQNPDGLQKDIWKEMAEEIGTTWYNCYQKFRILKRTYCRYLHRNRETGYKKIIKWPYYNYFSRICSAQTPGPWTTNKIKLLLHAYLQRAHHFRDPKYQKKELWKEISHIVGEKANMCDRKYRNLKQTYLTVKHKAQSGRGSIKWSYYRDFEIIENATYSIPLNDNLLHDPIHRLQEENNIKRMLTFYIENKDKFNNCYKKKKHLWAIISPELGMSPEACDRKFRNLKQTYLRLLDKRRITGEVSNWPYYQYFELIYEKPNVNVNNDKTQLDDVVMSEIRRVVEEVQEQRDRDRKFEKLMQVAEESNNIQRERNLLLKALIHRS